MYSSLTNNVESADSSSSTFAMASLPFPSGTTVRPPKALHRTAHQIESNHTGGSCTRFASSPYAASWR